MTRNTILLALFPGLIVLAGCGSQNPVASNATTDPAAQYASAAGVQTQVQSAPDDFEIDTYEDGTAAKPDMAEAPSGAASFGTPSPDAAIEPAFWFRLISSHQRHIDVTFDHPDTNTVVANVKVTDRLLGTFNVVTRPDTVDGQITERSWIKKPLADTGIRYARFVRHRIAGTDTASVDADNEDGYRDGWSAWRLTGLSGHEITSDNGTRQILSVRVQAGDLDTTYTDPLVLQDRSNLARIPSGVPVTVTATTGDPTDVVVIYTRWGRRRMAPVSPGVYQGSFLSPEYGGLRHIAVNALSHGTLFDDAGPYDSLVWGIPFVVGPPPVASNQ
jgi:hypothetical protein